MRFEANVIGSEFCKDIYIFVYLGFPRIFEQPLVVKFFSPQCL